MSEGAASDMETSGGNDSGGPMPTLSFWTKQWSSLEQELQMLQHEMQLSDSISEDPVVVEAPLETQVWHGHASVEIVTKLQAEMASQKVRTEMQHAEHVSTVAELDRTAAELDQTENKLIAARKEVSSLRRQLAGASACQRCEATSAAAEVVASEVGGVQRALQMQRELKHQVELQLSEEQQERQQVEGQLIEQRSQLQQNELQLRELREFRAATEHTVEQQQEAQKAAMHQVITQAETAEKARRQLQRKLLEQKGAHDEVVKQLEQTLAEERSKSVANKHRADASNAKERRELKATLKDVAKVDKLHQSATSKLKHTQQQLSETKASAAALQEQVQALEAQLLRVQQTSAVMTKDYTTAITAAQADNDALRLQLQEGAGEQLQADVFRLRAEMGAQLGAALKDNAALQSELTSVKAFVDELLQSMAGKWVGNPEQNKEIVKQPQHSRQLRGRVLPSP